VPFFAVWRNRVRGGGSWIEVSAGYEIRAEAAKVTPQRQGVPEQGVYKLVVEAPTEDVARRAFEHWESTNRPRSPSD
jgi:hypothetical protein